MSMDPQTVKEIDDGFYELNLSVRQTDQTFLDVLGPMASQIRESTAKNANTAVSNQNNITNQLQQTYSKSKAIADKQNQLYKSQLQRRGYDITQSGKEIKITDELALTQQAYLDKLDKEIQKENELIATAKDPVKKFRELAGATNSLEGFIKILEDKMFEMTGKSTGGAIALQGTVAAVTGITKAFGAMTDAIWQGERGASVGAKGVTEFSKSMTTAAYGISAALISLPLGPVLKIAGVMIAVLTAAAEKATKLVEMGAKLNDDLYKSYNTLSEKGVTTAKGMNGLYDSLHRVGIAAANIEKFNKILGENSRNMSVFGGTVAAGAEKFEKVANVIATPTSAINKQFLLMGINADAQREHIMKYLAEEERLGLSKGITDAQQVKNAQRYIENLDKLSSLTGANRKELEEARATVMANENLRAAIFDAEQDKTEEGKARLAELKRFYEAAAMLQAAGDTKGATGIAEYAAGRGITGKASATAFIQFGGKGGLIEKTKKGASAAELAEAANAGYKRQMEMMADTKRIGGDTSGMMTGTFAQGQEFGARVKELTKKSEEAGYTSVADYIDAEQEAKKNSKDDTTKKNAELRQLQEQTAMKLDDAAKFMDGAALGVASSMKLFNEAVELFTDATNKIAKEKGLDPIKKADPEAITKEIKQLKESLRIKTQSIANLDPKLEMNASIISRLKSEIETINTSLANAEKRKVEADKIAVVLKDVEKETPEYIVEQLRKGALSSGAANEQPTNTNVPTANTEAQDKSTEPKQGSQVTPVAPGPGAQVPSTSNVRPEAQDKSTEPKQGTKVASSNPPVSTEQVPSTSNVRPEAQDKSTEPKQGTKVATPASASGAVVTSVNNAKIDKEIDRFKQNNNMTLDSNKDYVAKLESKKEKLGSPVAPVTRPTSTAPSTQVAPVASKPQVSAPSVAVAPVTRPTSTAPSTQVAPVASNPQVSAPSPAPIEPSAAPATSMPNTKESLFAFGSKSGSKSNFEALSDNIKTRIINAAGTFNQLTGNKIAVNSARRDPEDQQRLWDESVRSGRPGRSPTGMPIAKPGTSKHERGMAIDIQNYNDPAAVQAMNQQGLFQTVPRDPVHFEAAKTGAMFEGPTEGYFVQLHGKEFVGNEQQLSAIKKLIDVVKEKGLITGVETTASTVESEFDSDESAIIIEKFTNMMQSKTDELIDKIKFGNRVDEDLLNYSQG